MKLEQAPVKISETGVSIKSTKKKLWDNILTGIYKHMFKYYHNNLLYFSFRLFKRRKIIKMKVVINFCTLTTYFFFLYIRVYNFVNEIRFFENDID